MGRPRTARLSPEIIGQAAIGLVESGRDLHVVTLAERLGVHVSSLYHHVAGRDGILLAMRDVIVAQHEYSPPPVESSWQERIRFEIKQVWRIYARYPRSIQILISLIVDQPNQLNFYSSLVDSLTEAGLPDNEILVTLGAIDAFALGAALDTLSPEIIFDATAAESRMRSLLRNYPSGSERIYAVVEQGMELLILGISERIRQSTERSSR